MMLCWTRMCLLNASERVKLLSHSGRGHVNGFSPVWLLRWLSSAKREVWGLPLRMQPVHSHMYLLLWMPMCSWWQVVDEGLQAVECSPQSFHWQVTWASVLAEAGSRSDSSASSSPSGEAVRRRASVRGCAPSSAPSEPEVEMSESEGEGARCTCWMTMLAALGCFARMAGGGLCGDEGGLDICCLLVRRLVMESVLEQRRSRDE